MECFRKHCRQTDMYLSCPPITLTSCSFVVRREKGAGSEHIIHTAVRWSIASAEATRRGMSPKGFLWNVPLSAATITVFPSLAIFSQNSCTSGKNCPCNRKCQTKKCEKNAKGFLSRSTLRKTSSTATTS